MEKKRNKFYLLLSICLLLIANVDFVFGKTQTDENYEFENAKKLLEDLSPEEKIGQLFIISFQGQKIDLESDLFSLLSQYQIGGVILSRENENFSDQGDILLNVQEFNHQIQKTAWEFSQSLSFSIDTENLDKTFIPLFIGISQEGDLYPFDQLLSGISSLPNQMAIGATFSTDFAQQTGEILSKELTALGFNFLLGPSLDVLDTTFNGINQSLSTRTFGGDPFWVGELGKAYIHGLHIGSDRELIVVSKHFPGRGSSDRLPEEEVATVRKSLEQLKLIELAPFFEVADYEKNNKTEISDGFLVSHIRYQGFQGNIRETTKPVSFDTSALNLILGLPRFNSWRKNGGVLVSDSLGSEAVRDFFDPSGLNFDAKQIALNAFLAGNDLLYLDNFQATGDESEFKTITETLNFFTQKYKEDEVFADRVDESVLRILTLKYKLYSVFTPSQVYPYNSDLEDIGTQTEIILKVARNAATLINPKLDEFSVVIPEPPNINDQMVFITDTVQTTQCDQCDLLDIFPENGLMDAVKRLYGSEGTNQVLDRRVRSYTFSDLNQFLNDSKSRADVGSFLSAADWVIFSILDLNPTRENSNALKRILTEDPELLRDKNVIVFGFNNPYYLDATDLASIDVYYCLFSKTPSFIEAAARLLFQEIVPKGHSPISIPVVGYNLIEMTYPNPSQIIGLEIEIDNLPEEKLLEIDFEDPSSIIFRIGDSLPVATNMILDRNGIPVPDGTIVQFTIQIFWENDQILTFNSETVEGIARLSFPVQSYGRIEISAQSDPAANSEILILDIKGEEGGVISEITPTSIPTLVNLNELIDSDGVNVSPVENIKKEPIPGFLQWFSSVIVIIVFAALIYFFSQKKHSLLTSGFGSLGAVLGGFISLIWFQLDFPGTFIRANFVDLIRMIFWITVFSSICGLSFGFFQNRKMKAKTRKS